MCQETVQLVLSVLSHHNLKAKEASADSLNADIINDVYIHQLDGYEAAAGTWRLTPQLLVPHIGISLLVEVGDCDGLGPLSGVHQRYRTTDAAVTAGDEAHLQRTSGRARMKGSPGAAGSQPCRHSIAAPTPLSRLCCCTAACGSATHGVRAKHLCRADKNCNELPSAPCTLVYVIT